MSWQGSWLPGGGLTWDGTQWVINGSLYVNGTTTTLRTINLLVEDKLITLNDGGLAASGGGAGMEIEEAGVVTGYFKTNAARTGWELCSPADTDKLTIFTPTAADATLSVSGGAVINQNCSTSGDPQFNSVTVGNAGLHIFDTNASHDLVLKAGSDLTADRLLTLTTGDSARTLTINGDTTLNDWFDQSVKQAATPTFGGITIAGANIVDTGDNGGFTLPSTPAHFNAIVTGVSLRNDAASTVVIPLQCNPAVHFDAHTWDTDDARDDRWQWKQWIYGGSGPGTSSAMYWTSMKTVNGAEQNPVNAMNITNAGALTLASSLTLGSSLNMPSGVVYGINCGPAASITTDGSMLTIAVPSARTNASGTQNLLKLAITYNQNASTSTANNTDLLIARTESSVGRGNQLLVDAQISGNSIAGIDRLGGFYVGMISDVATLYPCMITEVDAGTDNRFEKAADSTDKPMGPIGTHGGTYTAATGLTIQGNYYPVVFGGIAHVAPWNGSSPARDNIVFASNDAGGGGYAEFSATVAGANHNAEVGHCLETVATATTPTASVSVANNTFTPTVDPGYQVGDPVIYWTPGTPAAPLANGQVMFVLSGAAGAYTFSATRGGAVIDLTGTGDNNAQYLMKCPSVMIHFN